MQKIRSVETTFLKRSLVSAIWKFYNFFLFLNPRFCCHAWIWWLGFLAPWRTEEVFSMSMLRGGGRRWCWFGWSCWGRGAECRSSAEMFACRIQGSYRTAVGASGLWKCCFSICLQSFQLLWRWGEGGGVPAAAAAAAAFVCYGRLHQAEGQTEWSWWLKFCLCGLLGVCVSFWKGFDFSAGGGSLTLIKLGVVGLIFSKLGGSNSYQGFIHAGRSFFLAFLQIIWFFFVTVSTSGRPSKKTIRFMNWGGGVSWVVPGLHQSPRNYSFLLITSLLEFFGSVLLNFLQQD